MRKALVFLSVCFFAHPSFAKLNVVTTTTTLGTLAKVIGGERVRVQSLVKGPQDPHFVEAKPSYMVILRDADLVVAVGLELEAGYLKNLQLGSRNTAIQQGQKGYIELGAGIETLEKPQGTHLDRSEGDVHPAGNPHFALDPERFLLAGKNLRDRFILLDSAGKTAYEENYQKFSEALLKRVADWRQRIKKTSVKKLVTYHKAFTYFFSAFGLELLATIEPKPGIAPSPKHLIELVEKMKTTQVTCVFYESFFKPEGAEKIKASVPNVSIQTVAPEVEALPMVKDYFDLLENIVKALESCAHANKARS